MSRDPPTRQAGSASPRGQPERADCGRGLRMCYPLALAKWSVRSPEFPDSKAVVNYYNQIITQTSYFAICGAKGCIRACMDNLEKKKRIEQSNFKTPVWPRPAWKLSRRKRINAAASPKANFRNSSIIPPPIRADGNNEAPRGTLRLVRLDWRRRVSGLKPISTNEIRSQDQGRAWR